MKDLAATLFVLRLAKLILEIALLSLVGQAVLWAMIRGVGRDPATNLFYRMLQVIVSPFVRLVRLVTPRFVPDRHLPWAVFGLLLVGYAWTLFAIANACIAHGLTIAQCQEIR